MTASMRQFMQGRSMPIDLLEIGLRWGLRDGRREPLSQPVTRHGKTARYSYAQALSENANLRRGLPFVRFFMGLGLEVFGAAGPSRRATGRLASMENGTRRA
jgi:hypothetical protein